MRQRISEQMLLGDTGSPYSHAHGHAHAHLLPLPNTPCVASQMRQRISERVQAGDIDAALELTRQLAPGLLEGNRRIHFRLQCQKFAEMVGAALFLPGMLWASAAATWAQAAAPVHHLPAPHRFSTPSSPSFCQHASNLDGWPVLEVHGILAGLIGSSTPPPFQHPCLVCPHSLPCNRADQGRAGG